MCIIVAAGYSLSEVIAAGYSLSEARAAGYSLSEVKEWESIPEISNLYTVLNDDIKNKRRKHNQAGWGPENDPKENLCGTQMCTAGHIVNMADNLYGVGYGEMTSGNGFRKDGFITGAKAILSRQSASVVQVQKFSLLKDEPTITSTNSGAELPVVQDRLKEWIVLVQGTVNRLDYLKKYHINPYNLGDGGEVGSQLTTLKQLLSKVPNV